MSIFVKYMHHLLNKFDAQFFQTYVVPLLCNCIDVKNAPALQVAAIQIIVDDDVLHLIEQGVFVSDVIPRICRETCKTVSPAVKVSVVINTYYISLLINVICLCL